MTRDEPVALRVRAAQTKTRLDGPRARPAARAQRAAEARVAQQRQVAQHVHGVLVERQQPPLCEERGITRDCTPFLLILQGMALQLQGIALPPF